MKNNVKIIFHIDMNAFFISCELIKRKNLRNKAVAIAGQAAKFNKGVVVTASYEARKFGVKAAMPVFQARALCPHLIIIPGNRELYKEYSEKFIQFLKRYTDLIEVASIDEAYLDMTKRCEIIHPMKLATELQQKLMELYELPCSIGIATTKFLAKMASDMKKPMGITVLRNKEIATKLWPLPIGEMFGIGKKTAPKLIEAGIHIIGDLVKDENRNKALSVLGNQFDHFYQHALGYGNNIVNPESHAENKSVGHSSTFIEFITVEKKAYHHLQELTEAVANRLKRHQYSTKTISVQIKYATFKTHSKSQTIDHYTQDTDEIYQVVLDLFDELWNREPIRLLGVSTANIMDHKEMNNQFNLFNYEKFEEEEPIVRLVNDIKRKFGEDAIKKGIKK